MWSMFKGPQGMSLPGNAAAAYAAAAYATAASASATSAATAAADKTKMCDSSLIFRPIKWRLIIVGSPFLLNESKKKLIVIEKSRADRFMKIDINHPQYT